MMRIHNADMAEGPMALVVFNDKWTTADLMNARRELAVYLEDCMLGKVGPHCRDVSQQ